MTTPQLLSQLHNRNADIPALPQPFPKLMSQKTCADDFCMCFVEWIRLVGSATYSQPQHSHFLTVTILYQHLKAPTLPPIYFLFCLLSALRPSASIVANMLEARQHQTLQPLHAVAFVVAIPANPGLNPFRALPHSDGPHALADTLVCHNAIQLACVFVCHNAILLLTSSPAIAPFS